MIQLKSGLVLVLSLGVCILQCVVMVMCLYLRVDKHDLRRRAKAMSDLMIQDDEIQRNCRLVLKCTTLLKAKSSGKRERCEECKLRT